jgi:hypothetical protein
VRSPFAAAANLTGSGTNCPPSKNWIYAALMGSITGSDDVNLVISQHNLNGPFQFGASGGPDENPFTAATSAGSSSGSTANACPEESSPASVAATQAAAAATTTTGGSLATVVASGFFGNPYVQATGRPGKVKRAQATGCATSSTTSQGNSNALNMKLAAIGEALPMKEMAHGILAGLCFAVFFPLGAISIRLFSFSGLVWFHAGIQIITTVIFIVAVGLGISMVQDIQTLSFGEANYVGFSWRIQTEN